MALQHSTHLRDHILPQHLFQAHYHPFPAEQTVDMPKTDTASSRRPHQSPLPQQPAPSTIKQLSDLATFTVMRMVVERWKKLTAQHCAEPGDELEDDRAQADRQPAQCRRRLHDPLKTPLTPPHTPHELGRLEPCTPAQTPLRYEARSNQRANGGYHPYARPLHQTRPRPAGRGSATSPLASSHPRTPLQPCAFSTPQSQEHKQQPVDTALTASSSSFHHTRPLSQHASTAPAPSPTTSSSRASAASSTTSYPSPSPTEKHFLDAYSQRHAAHLHLLTTTALTSLPLPWHATVLALLFARRLLQQPLLPAPLSTPTKVFLAGLLLADAQLCDATVPMRTWATVTGARGGGRQVAAIKRAALEVLGFDVAVGAEAYGRWLVGFREFFARGVGAAGGAVGEGGG
ncbi:hypothetical protein DFJ73DRAFT_914046 [Zopfochytrium polystomum]|nr:hypothetical protein DFJ73DRAFT_914046 [Zopfochytrium polystomum]